MVLAAAVVVAVDAWEVDRGLAPREAPQWAPWAAYALTAAAAAVVVTGTVATMAGPHAGDPDVRRLGNLVDAVYVHVRATAVFGIAFVALVAWLFRRRDPLLRLALFLLALLVTQMALGEIQWRTQLPWGVVLAHVALAAAVWSGTVLLATLVVRARAPKLDEWRSSSGSPTGRS